MILPTPSPRSVRVCSVCSGPWDEHTDMATARAYMHLADDEPRPAVEVTLLDCIGVLQALARGAIGPAR